MPKLRVFMGAQHGYQELDLVKCECCKVYCIASTTQMDAHGQCPLCQEPRELACDDCGMMAREDLLDAGLCEACTADAYERDEQSAEE